MVGNSGSGCSGPGDSRVGGCAATEVGDPVDVDMVATNALEVATADATTAVGKSG